MRERDKERERSDVCSRSGVILCASQAQCVCVPGLYSSLIHLFWSPVSHSAPHYTSDHSYTCCAKAMKLLMYLFTRMATGLYVVLGNSSPLIHF